MDSFTGYSDSRSSVSTRCYLGLKSTRRHLSTECLKLVPLHYWLSNVSCWFSPCSYSISGQTWNTWESSKLVSTDFATLLLAEIKMWLSHSVLVRLYLKYLILGSAIQKRHRQGPKEDHIYGQRAGKPALWEGLRELGLCSLEKVEELPHHSFSVLVMWRKLSFHKEPHGENQGKEIQATLREVSLWCEKNIFL